MLAIAIFEMSLCKALNNGKIDKQEFSILQELQHKVVIELANVDYKMETETRTQLQKSLLDKINEIKKTLRTRDALGFAYSFLLLSSMLPKWISSEISTINLLIFGKANQPSENSDKLARSNHESSNDGYVSKLSGKCIGLLKSI